MFSGGQMTLDGRVDGDVLGSSGNYSRNGSIGGTEKVTSGRPEAAAPPTAGDRVLGAVRRYLAILLVGALLLWLAPRLLRSSAGRARARPLPSLGVGALGAIDYGLLIIAIILVAVFVSIGLGFLGFASLVSTLGFGALLAMAALTFALVLVIVFIADAIVGIAAASLLWRSESGLTWARSFVALALGVAVVVPSPPFR